MANVITGRQLSATAPGTLFQTQVKVNSIEFSDGTVAGHQCNLTDRQGRPVWNGIMSASLEADSSPKLGWIDGLILTRIDSGIVIVYIE